MGIWSIAWEVIFEDDSRILSPDTELHLMTESQARLVASQPVLLQKARQVVGDLNSVLTYGDSSDVKHFQAKVRKFADKAKYLQSSLTTCTELAGTEPPPSSLLDVIHSANTRIAQLNELLDVAAAKTTRKQFKETVMNRILFGTAAEWIYQLDSSENIDFNHLFQILVDSKQYYSTHDDALTAAVSRTDLFTKVQTAKLSELLQLLKTRFRKVSPAKEKNSSPTTVVEFESEETDSNFESPTSDFVKTISHGNDSFQTCPKEPIPAAQSLGSLELFLRSHQGSLKCHCEDFLQWLLSQDVSSLHELAEAIDDDYFFAQMQAHGLKVSD